MLGLPPITKSVAIMQTAALLLLGVSAAALADTTTLSPDKAAFRALYKELVETNTTLSSGSCTLAAERMATPALAAPV